MKRAALHSAAGSALALSLLFLAGCASSPRDGAPSNPPSNLSQSADAEPRVETIRSSGGTSKPYTVLGVSYAPITDDRSFRESGLASWYGKKFHAQSTASGEPYDMYAMTAAHKTLPLPSYVRVRNPANGREAIVRVNDRGPFVEGRVIDLSYAAAAKLDLLRGVAPVEIERITNQDIRAGTWRRDGSATALAAASTTSAASTAAPVASSAPSAPTNGEVAVPSVMVMPVVSAAQPEVRPIVAMPLPAGVEPPAGPPAVGLTGNAPTSVAADAQPASPAPGYWIQLGAFSQREGAQALRQRVTSNMPSLGSDVYVFNERGMYRVQAGPYASRTDAGGTADQIRNGMQLAPIVVERR
ncbi:septal ring lytic transglycosylase RlpA family protein [Variovorax sp. J22R133]|nr:septal ring lytic transglycosylase RlpA family protein [Variovorax sp. J22R133]MDM0115296.1 septal ring lytic transglycosylase RlpA family protein [Variovorax sp. J22R133]